MRTICVILGQTRHGVKTSPGAAAMVCELRVAGRIIWAIHVPRVTNELVVACDGFSFMQPESHDGGRENRLWFLCTKIKPAF